MLSEEISIAQKIIGTSYSNLAKDIPYHNISHIYRTTNEQIINYQEHLKSRKNMLSVIASGDQILNSILEGTRNIDGFDISCFPKYYLELKIAAIKTLSKENFIDLFFANMKSDENYDDMYDELRKELPKDNKKFWDSLFSFFDWSDIINSTLFSSEPVITSNVINQNKYLQRNNYEKLKERLNKVNLDYYTGDISTLANTLSQEYDFINLSSIVYYKKVEDYTRLIKSLNLTEEGEALTYFYKLGSALSTPEFKELAGKFELFPDQTSGIMLYKRPKVKIR